MAVQTPNNSATSRSVSGRSSPQDHARACTHGGARPRCGAIRDVAEEGGASGYPPTLLIPFGT